MTQVGELGGRLGGPKLGPRPVRSPGAKRRNADGGVNITNGGCCPCERAPVSREILAHEIHARRVQQKHHVQVLVDRGDEIAQRQDQRVRIDRQHERVPVRPPGNQLQPGQPGDVRPQRTDDGVDVIAADEPQRPGRGNQGSALPEAAGDRADAGLRRKANGDVEHQHGHERGKRGKPEGRQRSQYDGGRGEDRKHGVPRASLDSPIACEPPDVVPLWILQARERYLRPFPDRRIDGQSVNECLERVEMRTERSCSETMIQSVLAECALRAIDRRKDVVEVEVSPRPVVERAGVRERVHPCIVQCGQHVHATVSFDRCAPVGANRGEAFPAAATDPGDHEEQDESGNRHPQRVHRGFTLAERAMISRQASEKIGGAGRRSHE